MLIGLTSIAAEKLTIDDLLVFSAPRYCDSTENRGAYINIGPDYKLRYEQFDAVPHPNIRPMVSLPLIPLPSDTSGAGSNMIK